MVVDLGSGVVIGSLKVCHAQVGEGGCCRGVRTKGQTGARSRVRVCPLIRLDYRSSHPNSDDAVLRK